MIQTKYLIIGGGIAGTSAAESIRTVDKNGSIIIVSDEPYLMYSRIMLSKPSYFLDQIPEERIFLKNDKWYDSQEIELISGKKAISLDAQNKIIKLFDGSELQYEKLLLATGSNPRKWNVSGGEKDGVFSLRILEDCKKIKNHLQKEVKRVALVGGGFISFEMCDLLCEKGLNVTLILRESHYWEPILDEASGKIIEKAFVDGGIKIFYNSEIAEVLGSEFVNGVILKSGEKIPCEIIIAGIGICCEIDWVKNAGIETNHGILANEYLETNLKDIWTAGDVAEYYDPILEERAQLGNWSNAQLQGRRAGLNMTGQKEQFRFVSSYSTSGFHTNITFIGNVRPEGKEIITRRDADANSYGRIFTLDGEIVGAALVNYANETNTISKLIEKDIKIIGKEKDLSDPKFNLSALL